jgi:hypothetical protein
MRSWMSLPLILVVVVIISEWVNIEFNVAAGIFHP